MDTHIAMHPTPLTIRPERTARPIQFFQKTILRGCNAYHTKSVIRLRIDFGKFEGKQSVWAKGIKFVEELSDSDGHFAMFYVSDPAGHRVEVSWHKI